jgi:hypothetical protein
MSYSHRIFVYGPVGLLVLVFVLYSVFWRVEADTLSARLDSANGGELIPGVEFAFAEKSIGGYPFRLDAVLSGVTFAHREPDGEIAWRTEKLALHSMSYNATRFIMEAAGLQSFARPGAAGGPPNVITVQPALARASAILVNGRLARFDLDVLGPKGKDASLNADATRTFAADRAQLHLLRRADGSIDVAMKIENADVGKGYGLKFGGKIPLIDLRGKVDQAGALDALSSGSESVAQAADDWRGKNGALEVQRLALDWDGVKTDMTGALSLDEAHRLTGALTGAFNPGDALRAVTGGKFGLQLSGETPLTLLFKDGDILAVLGSVDSALGRTTP